MPLEFVLDSLEGEREVAEDGQSDQTIKYSFMAQLFGMG